MPAGGEASQIYVRPLKPADWPAYKALCLEDAAARAARPEAYKHGGFYGDIGEAAARPDIFWENSLAVFTRFGAFAEDNALLGVLGVVVLGDEGDNHHAGHLFGRCVSRRAAGEAVMEKLERHFTGRSAFYRRLYKNLDKLYDYSGTQKDLLQWLQLPLDMDRPVTGISPFLLKEG
jgi:hypothetical protein